MMRAQIVGGLQRADNTVQMDDSRHDASSCGSVSKPVSRFIQLDIRMFFKPTS